MASFVEVNDQAVLDVIKHALETLNNQETSQKCLTAYEKEDYATVFEIVLNTINTVLQKTKEGDAEVFALVLLHIASKISKKDKQLENLSAKVAESTERAELRLRVLANLLSAVEQTDAQYLPLFIRTLQYAQKTKQSLPVEQYNLDKIAQSDKRQVYLLFASILRESGKQKEAYTAYRNYLSTIDTADDNTSDAVKQAIRVTYQFDQLLQVPAVKQLEQKNAKLFALVKILNSGTYQDYVQFASANNVEEISSVSATELETKMRLLTLCSMCTSVSELTYEQVAQKLSVDVKDVEKWIIRCVSANLIDAKLNQLQNKVFINKSIHRTFGATEWQQVQKQLQDWTVSLDNIAKVIAQQKQT